MYFKRLEVQGFKTFANRTVLEFRPGVTAVVGPNGSGKSNIADAVRWVLGEQSFANLRCKKTEELLFSGGGRRPPAGLAEVSLTIDNSDRLLPLAFDEVTITRRATRAGDNEYFINRARVRLRDVQEAVEPLGDSYTIINQGLVDAALTLRPEERRRLFEDAAEIGGYEVRKAEAERRMRETDTNVQRLGDLLSELEPRLRSLKRQAGQARQHRELSDELRGLLTSFYSAQWRAAAAAARASAANVAQLETELAAARERQTRASAELRTLREALRSRRDSLGELHRQSSELHRHAEAAQRELAVGNERLAALTRRHEELERSQGELALRQSETDHERQAAETALAAAESHLHEQRSQLGQAEQEIAAIEQARRSLARELSQAQDSAVHARTELATMRSRAEQLANQRTRLTRDQAELATALRQADERLTGARQQLEAAQRDLAASEATRTAAAETEQAAHAALDGLRAERGRTDEALASARRTLADREARYESLTRLARSYSGAFAGVKAAMQWAEKVGRGGFALISSIIRTPAEIEVAVEVALGSRLQNIVVDTWQDAEEAIAELKRSGVGRATFMPLDSLRRTENSRGEPGVRPTDNGVLGVAAELVEYDARYAPAVQQLLGRVLIVRDLPTARTELRRLPGGWNIVTLGGEQVNTGGAVTGGAPTKETGTLRRERELRELPQQVQQAQAAVAEAETHRNQLAEQVAAATQALREAESKSREAQRLRDSQRTSLDAATRRAAQAEQEYTWQQQRHDSAANDMAALDAQEQALVAQQAQAEARAATAETHVNELRARQEAEAESTRAAQERFASMRAAVASAESQLQAQRNLVASHRHALERLARQQAELARSADALSTERVQISATHDQAEARHRMLLEDIDRLRAQIDPAEAELVAEETRQTALEEAETLATSALLENESAHGRAAVEAQRARDRVDTLEERAAAENIEINSRGGQAADGAATPDEPLDMAGLQSRIDGLREKLNRLGSINPLALEEYDETFERQQFLSSQISDLQQARRSLLELINELESAMHARFDETFRAVAVEFERSFTQLFGGGSGRLMLTRPSSNSSEEPGNGVEDEAAPAASRPVGVEIIARPPGKRQQNLSLLSGGERTLTAAALLFAILTVNPSPFCILDEVDAALDESNVGRFRDALAALTGGTQFILITHNRGTIEAANTLYGVTMGEDGASKVLSMRVEELLETAA
ncbi:MAG: chromosome segregation protein SMC [Chloroflexaceae bacterium]|nr:chromosome segregation protein SMC [Chloroflexaceae bacterium]